LNKKMEEGVGRGMPLRIEGELDEMRELRAAWGFSGEWEGSDVLRGTPWAGIANANFPLYPAEGGTSRESVSFLEGMRRIAQGEAVRFRVRYLSSFPCPLFSLKPHLPQDLTKKNPTTVFAKKFAALVRPAHLMSPLLQKSTPRLTQHSHSGTI
jgi:hypothetical protein